MASVTSSPQEQEEAQLFSIDSDADQAQLAEREKRFSREYNQARRKSRVVFCVLLILLLAAFFVSFCIGRYSAPAETVLDSIFGGLGAFFRALPGGVTGAAAGLMEWTRATPENTVVWLVRMPRILAAILVGAALSVSGATYQGLFRNPMVSPDILGASAGASVGACLMMLLDKSGLMIQFGAFLMGIGAVALSYFLSKAIGRGSNAILILVLCGMTVNTLFQAFVSIIKYMADPDSQLPEMTYWLMGSIAKVGYSDVLLFFIPFLLGVVPVVVLRWRINLLSFGEDEAKSLGINVTRIRLISIICATLLTAAVVSVAGTIGWVGLMIPHVVRFVVGPNNKTVIPVSLLAGGLFMLIVDNFCRALLSYEIPLGVLTSLLGAPFFIFILYKRRGNN